MCQCQLRLGEERVPEAVVRAPVSSGRATRSSRAQHPSTLNPRSRHVDHRPDAGGPITWFDEWQGWKEGLGGSSGRPTPLSNQPQLRPLGRFVMCVPVEVIQVREEQGPSEIQHSSRVW